MTIVSVAKDVANFIKKFSVFAASINRDVAVGAGARFGGKCLTQRRKERKEDEAESFAFFAPLREAFGVACGRFGDEVETKSSGRFGVPFP